MPSSAVGSTHVLTSWKPPTDFLFYRVQRADRGVCQEPMWGWCRLLGLASRATDPDQDSASITSFWELCGRAGSHTRRTTAPANVLPAGHTQGRLLLLAEHSAGALRSEARSCASHCVPVARARDDGVCSAAAPAGALSQTGAALGPQPLGRATWSHIPGR